jgi:hypothetical protein
MSKKIIPTQFKTHAIQQIIESISEEANTIYYAFVGDHVSSGETEQEVIQPDLSSKTLNTDTYRNMVFGKRIFNEDMKIMIKRYDWVANTVFASYDDEDINLLDKNFYIMTDEGEFKHIYKCLDNANGAPSTAQPVFNDITFDDSDNYYETSDGYQWKYMYSINSTQFARFATQKYIPVVANTEVESTAKNGTIDVIRISTEQRLGTDISLNGKFYNNYLTDIGFTETDVLLGNTVQYRLPFTATSVPGFYKNTILHIVSGIGAGQYRRVVNSYADSIIGGTFGIYAEIESAFLVAPDGTSRYELGPEVKVIGNGTETIQAAARAVINANASNSVHRVEILEPGRNYSFATAEVLTGAPASAEGTGVGDLIVPTPAQLRPIIPPPGGHGANTAAELGGDTLCIYMKFTGEEDGYAPIENSFAQFGILSDPVFANVEISFIKPSDNLDGSDGQFIFGERVNQFKKILLSDTVDTQISNNIFVSSSNNSIFDTYLTEGQFVYIKNNLSPQLNYLSEITQVINSTAFACKDDCGWGENNSLLYLAKVIAEGNVNLTINPSTITLNNVYGRIIKDELIIGNRSFAVANVQHIDINSKYPSPTNYNFDIFTQYTRCEGTVSGSFIEDEVVFQGADANDPVFQARVHSANSTVVYLTNIDGRINTALPLSAVTSGALLSPPFNKYDGDLDATAGTILYLQNDIPVTRANNRSEEIRVILEF